MADVTKNKDESYKFPACGFTPPAGKEFKVWQVDGTEKNVGDNIVLSGNKNIKAVWNDIEEFLRLHLFHNIVKRKCEGYYEKKF